MYKFWDTASAPPASSALAVGGKSSACFHAKERQCRLRLSRSLCDVAFPEDNSSAVDIDTRPSNASKAPCEDLNAEPMMGRVPQTVIICVLDAQYATDRTIIQRSMFLQQSSEGRCEHREATIAQNVLLHLQVHGNSPTANKALIRLSRAPVTCAQKYSTWAWPVLDGYSKCPSVFAVQFLRRHEQRLKFQGGLY